MYKIANPCDFEDPPARVNEALNHGEKFSLEHAPANPDVFWYRLTGMGAQKNPPK